MAQHDYIIENDSGANVRSDINNALQAILTVNSGTTEPSATAAGMWWGDMSNADTYYLKQRNHDNTDWVSLFAYTVATKTMKPMISGVTVDTYITNTLNAVQEW